MKKKKKEKKSWDSLRKKHNVWWWTVWYTNERWGCWKKDTIDHSETIALETLVTRNALTRCKWDIAANGQYFSLSLSLSFLFFLSFLLFLSFFLYPYRRVPLIDYRSSLSIVSTYLHRSTESCISCLTVEVGSKFSSVALKGLDDKSLGQIPYKALSAARRLKGSWVRTPGVRIIIWLHSDAFHF